MLRNNAADAEIFSLCFYLNLSSKKPYESLIYLNELIIFKLKKQQLFAPRLQINASLHMAFLHSLCKTHIESTRQHNFYVTEK